MAYLVEVSREANTEILEIYVFKGENNSFDAATRWYNGVVDALDTLKDFPVGVPTRLRTMFSRRRSGSFCMADGTMFTAFYLRFAQRLSMCFTSGTVPCSHCCPMNPKPILMDNHHPFSRWLTRFPSVVLCVTLRNDQDDENNMSFSVALDGNEVRENRIHACEGMRFKPAQLVVPAQTHGANVAVVGAADAGRGALSPDTAIPGCDALVTNTPGLLLGITVADCLPIFFLDPIHNVIGLAHSGWRGTAGRIAVRTLETMTARFGTHPAACLVAIGPGIGPDGYEVDKRVYNGFTPDDAQAEGVFTPTRPGHWRLDLFAAVTHQLKQAGVPPSNFDICPYRTDRDTKLFFSHRLVPGCGRMGAFLGMRETG